MTATDGPGNRISGMLAVRNSSTEGVVTIRQTVRRESRPPQSVLLPRVGVVRDGSTEGHEPVSEQQPALRLRVLGSMEAVGADGERLDLGGPRQRAVLAVLAIAHGRVVATDRIIDDLWRGEPSPKAMGSLQAYVSHLRRALDPGRAARTAAVRPAPPARPVLVTMIVPPPHSASRVGRMVSGYPAARPGLTAA